MDRARRTRWFLRGASLVFAVILWLFVTWDGTSLSTRSLSVPLAYQDLPDGYSISQAPQNVSVRLEGRLESLALLNRSDITAVVGMRDLRPGKYRLPVQLTAPGNVRVLSYSPNAVDFELFRMIERTIRPVLTLQDELPGGLLMSSVDITPSEIIIKGPEADVLAVRRAEARSTVREMTGGERELRVFLVSEGGSIDNLTVEPQSVMVRADFRENLQELRVPVKIQLTGVPGDGLKVGSVVISPDFVVLRGTKEALSGVAEISLHDIDISGLTDDMNADIPLEPPSDSMSIVGEGYVNVRVNLRSAAETRTFLTVPISLFGAESDERWSLSPPTASVTVERPVNSGAPFDPDVPPVELYVDVTNVVASQLTLPVLVRDVEDGLTIIRIDPQQVSVTAVAD
jgi:YbbR domain-containing protein